MHVVFPNQVPHRSIGYDQFVSKHAPGAIRRNRSETELRYLVGTGVSAAAIWRMREALDDARGLEPLEELSDMVLHSKEQVLHHCAVQLDEQHDYAAAVGLVRILMFIEKFTHDLNQRLDQFA